MIIAGVAMGVVLVVAIGMGVARRVQGQQDSFLVAGRAMALPLVAPGLMGQAVDTNATVGTTDLALIGGFWAGYTLPLGLAICLLLTGQPTGPSWAPPRCWCATWPAGSPTPATVVLALEVPETGVLLTLAFDVMLSSLVVPILARGVVVAGRGPGRPRRDPRRVRHPHGAPRADPDLLRCG